jgi:hypothetical protein
MKDPTTSADIFNEQTSAFSLVALPHENPANSLPTMVCISRCGEVRLRNSEKDRDRTREHTLVENDLPGRDLPITAALDQSVLT